LPLGRTPVYDGNGTLMARKDAGYLVRYYGTHAVAEE